MQQLQQTLASSTTEQLSQFMVDIEAEIRYRRIVNTRKVINSKTELPCYVKMLHDGIEALYGKPKQYGYGKLIDDKLEELEAFLDIE